MRVAFIVDTFPTTSETFLIDQIADLLDAGVHVQVFALHRGSHESIAGKYFTYEMQRLTRYLEPPTGRSMWFAVPGALWRLILHQPRLLHLFRTNTPRPLLRSRLLFLLAPFVGRDFDIYHCHFGPVARQYLVVREALRHTAPMVTTFYGYDVSAVLKREEPSYYAELQRECSLFFVMSNNMKDRVVAAGFDVDKVVVHPVSIRVDSFPFAERHWDPGAPLRIASVGRFVEKKGFDDLIRAIHVVSTTTTIPLQVFFVGGGPLESQLRQMTAERGLADVIRFSGYLSLEKVVALLTECHLFVQPSKTAADGDME